MARVSHRLPVRVCVHPLPPPEGRDLHQKGLLAHQLPSSGSCGMKGAACSGFGVVLKRGDWWLVGGFNTAQQPSQEGKRMLNNFWITQDGKSLLLTF